MQEAIVNEVQVAEEREQSATSYPWRRLFARHIDFSIYGIIWSCVQYFIFRWYYPHDNLFIKLLNNYIILTLMIFIEPLFLCKWGTTPGKAIFGLVLHKDNGSKLTYNEAFNRAFYVFRRGYGYGIPIYNLVRMYKCRKDSLNGVIMDWDDECNTDYQIKDTKGIRIVLYIMAEVLLSIITFAIVLQALMPLHRGDISPSQYAENINDILKRENMYQGFYMDENGHWYRGPYDNNVLYNPSNYEVDHEMIVENGIVQGVKFRLFSEEQGQHMYYPTIHKLYMTLAFFGAQKEVNCFTLNLNHELKTVLQSMENFSIELCGVRITQEIEYTGYMLLDNSFWTETGKTQSFKMTFLMERVD